MERTLRKKPNWSADDVSKHMVMITMATLFLPSAFVFIYLFFNTVSTGLHSVTGCYILRHLIKRVARFKTAVCSSPLSLLCLSPHHLNTRRRNSTLIKTTMRPFGAYLVPQRIIFIYLACPPFVFVTVISDTFRSQKTCAYQRDIHTADRHAIAIAIRLRRSAAEEVK